MWHKDRTGPLSSIYDVAEKAKETVGGRIRGSSSKESDQKEDATSE